MLRRGLLLVAALAATACAQAPPAARLLEQADQLAAQGDYRSALRTWEEVLRRHPGDPGAGHARMSRDLVARLLALEEERDRLRAELAAREADVERLRGELALRGGELARLRGEVAVRDAELARARRELATRQAEVERLHADAERLRADLEELKRMDLRQERRRR
jgi:chromosome segregation ATPase